MASMEYSLSNDKSTLFSSIHHLLFIITLFFLLVTLMYCSICANIIMRSALPCLVYLPWCSLYSHAQEGEGPLSYESPSHLSLIQSYLKLTIKHASNVFLCITLAGNYMITLFSCKSLSHSNKKSAIITVLLFLSCKFKKGSLFCRVLYDNYKINKDQKL